MSSLLQVEVKYVISQSKSKYFDGIAPSTFDNKSSLWHSRLVIKR